MSSRVVHHADAVEWLRQAGTLAGASIVTSLPDVSELPALGLDGWRRWFVAAAAACMNAVDDAGVALFFQSDVRRGGVWIDKGVLVAEGAARAGMEQTLHTIVCRLPPGTPSTGRATYAHLVGYARRPQPPRRGRADVLPDGGPRAGRKAMGVWAAREAVRYVRAETASHTIVDPFCGWGTVLAVANALGVDAVGVDLSLRMCRRARALRVELDGEQPFARAVAP